MATTQNLIEGVNNEVAKINEITKGGSLPQLTPLPSITPDSLQTDQPTIEAPVVEQQTPQVTVPDLQQQETAKAEAYKTAETQSFEDYLTSVISAPTVSEIQSEVYKEQGVDTLKAEVNRLNSEMISEQDALRTKLENIQRNGGGLKAGAQAEMANAERESLAKQADIALLQIAATGQWEVAQEVADRTVSAMFEREEKIAEARQLTYERYKELFNKSEQRAFEMAEADRQRKLDTEKENARILQNTKLSAMQMAQVNEAPQSVLRAITNATTPEEVISVGGQWGNTDMLEREAKRAQIASSYTNRLLALAAAGDPKAIEELGFDPAEAPKELDATTRRNAEAAYDATGDLLRMANEYKDLVDSKGFTNTIFGSGDTLGTLQSLRGQMTAAYKDAKKLGTLDAGLLELMEQILGEDPTSTFLVTKNITGKQSTKISASMRELIDQTTIENARNAHLLGKEPWRDPLDVLNEGIEETTSSNSSRTSTDPLGLSI